MTSSFRITYLVCENESDGLVNRYWEKVGRSNASLFQRSVFDGKRGKGRRVCMQRQQEEGWKRDNMN